MPKTKISEFSATPGNNTDIDGINIAEGCAPSGINDAIRELMAQLKDFQSGGAGDPITVVGTLAAAGTSSVAGDLKLYEQTTNGTNYAGFKSPTSLAANIQWVLPNADGTNGQALTTNGSGTLAWSTIAATPGGSNTQVQFNNSGAFGGSANFTFDGSNLQIGSQGDLRLGDSDNSNWVAFQAPATVASNVTWTLPSADGTNGQALVTNGSGTLSFSTISTSAATPTALGTVYGQTDSGATANTFLGYQAGRVNTASYNTILGWQAGYTNSTGTRNAFVGIYAGVFNTTGTDNSFFGGMDVSGYGAGHSNTTGSYNTALGTAALSRNTTASRNTAVGYQAAYTGTTATQNTIVGHQAGYYLTTGSYNVAIGDQALVSTTTGGNNVAIGLLALQANTTASNNTAVGYQAGYSNTTGNRLTAIGLGALYTNTTGVDNTALGANASYFNTTGSYNTALGLGSLQANTTASYNTGLGYQAGYSNTTAQHNTAVGSFALNAATTGGYNTAVGYNAGTGVTTNIENTFLGYQAGASGNGQGVIGIGYQAGRGGGSYSVWVGYNAGQSTSNSGTFNVGAGFYAGVSNTTGQGNVFAGYQAGQANTTGSVNVFIGGEPGNATGAGHSNTTGNYGVAIGGSALKSNTTAPGNTAVGYSTIYYVTTGQYNTALGYSVGSGWGGTYLTTGSGNTYIGYGANPSAAAPQSELMVSASSTYALNGKGSNTGFIAAYNGSYGGIYQGNNSSSWSTTSDFRLKKNIVDNNEGLEKIAAIRVRNFEYRLPEEVTDLDPKSAVDIKGVQLGVIAQELQQVCPDCVKEESTGVLSVDSDNVFWHMVNAIKQLKTELDTVKAELQTLKGN